MNSIKSDFNELDNITGGWQNGDLIMIAAPARMGKTAFALSIVSNNLLLLNKSIIWLSTAMSANQFKRMLFSNHTRTSIEDIIDGKTDDAEINEALEIIIKNNKFHYYDKSDLTNFEIKQILDSLCIDSLPDCIIIDNLNNLELDISEQYPKEKLTNIKLIQLKALARKLNIPILVLFDCEFPTPSGKDEFCVESIKLYFDKSLIDTLCYIYRPEYYKVIEDGVGESTLGKAFFIVAQNRSLTGSVLLEYEPKYIKFKACS